jgi:nanoRNase/pAp phosphatase (c-di-AMP/oligoRNAs hydrolase)
MAAERYRLVTRSDFDGLVCAVLLKALDLVDDIAFVHPKDVQDGMVPIGPGDITTNLPYSPQAHLVFDHHLSETLRNLRIAPNHVIDPQAPSAARVVYDYYGGRERFPNVAEELMQAVDQADSAQYDLEEVLHPTGWVLLNFLMDSRTGLGRFRDFRISNYQLMMQLIDECSRHGVEEILRCRTSRSGSTSTARSPSRSSSSSGVARAFVGRSPSSTCAPRRRSTPATASSSTPCTRTARSRRTCCGASSAKEARALPRPRDP